MVIAVLLISFTKKFNFAIDKPFLVVTSYSAGPNDYREMYDKNIAIHNDGRLVLYAAESNDPIIEVDAPVLEIQLTDKQVKHVKEVIEEESFWGLPRDISTPSEDGGYQYITVDLSNVTKKVGGLNTDNARFDVIYQSAWDLIEEDGYKKWIEEIEEHIWERNSLRRSEKTDFIMDEPFIVIRMDADLADYHHTDPFDGTPSEYDQVISINMEGELFLYPEVQEGRIMSIDRNELELKLQLTDGELKEVQELIQEHFWKLNETILNPESDKRTESITVHLTEEEKEVRTFDPVNHRFIAIRDSIINLIDEKEYESWIKNTSKILWEENYLHANDKDDFSEGESFLILSMEHEWDERFSKTYLQNVSIDTDGNVILFGDEIEGVQIGDNTPVLKTKATNEELKEVQELIREHFEEIEYYNTRGKGDMEMNSITVNLTHDTNTVTGNDPEDVGFMAIRNAVLELVDKEAYEAWEREFKAYISNQNSDL